MMNIGFKIKRLREIQGRSQKDIADLLNVDRRTYAKWEEGVTYIRSNLIPDIAEIFGVDIADLYKNIDDAEIKDSFSYHKNSVNSVIIMITDRIWQKNFCICLMKAGKTMKSRIIGHLKFSNGHLLTDINLL